MRVHFFLTFTILINLLTLSGPNSAKSAIIDISKTGRDGVGVIRDGQILKSNNIPKQLRRGDIIITSSQGSVRVRLKTNGKIFLAPDSEIEFLNSTEEGLRKFSLIGGELLFTTLDKDKGSIASKKPGALISLRDSKNFYHGNRYRLVYRKDEKFIDVLKESVEKVNLTD